MLNLESDEAEANAVSAISLKSFSLNQTVNAWVTSGFPISNISQPTLTTVGPNYDSGTLCGLPGICVGSAQDIYTKCFNKTLFDCQECGFVRGAIFLFVVVCLGLAILIGNGLTMFVGIRRCRRGKESKMDICRTSLATADALTSMQLLIVVTYNVSWSMNLTPLELEKKQIALRGSTFAIAAGFLNVFGLISSMFHLTFMALGRFYAIALPFKYKWQSKKAIYSCIGIIWSLVAIFTIFVTQWFTCAYSVPAFLFFPIPSVATLNPTNKAVFSVFGAIYLLPYFLTTTLIIATAIMICRFRKAKHIKMRKLNKINSNKNSLQQNPAPFITVAIMQFGFTISFLPTLIVGTLLYSGLVDCAAFSTAFMMSSYISFSNSLFNVVIYNVRDKEFRKEIFQLLKLKSVKSFFKKQFDSMLSKKN
ncbi:unnamed protein product [Clavelina lepadiformis]|uniref:G-protein coupled receptors family 1 profile domain-containing protein n=1 Tax=Clavelina lepadiformis TaxID=159417 RepID=A0ABP0GRB4_CLALP